MKRMLCLFLGVMALAATTSAQSLGEVARKSRTQKKPAATRVYTNDDLSTATTFNNGAASGPTATEPEADAEAKPAEKSTAPADKEKALADWRAKFDEQKKAISLLERELDVAQREHQQRVAAFYADAGNQLRNQSAWAEQDRKLQAEITAKQQALATGRQKLEELKEAARKAGMPSSAAE